MDRAHCWGAEILKGYDLTCTSEYGSVLIDSLWVPIHSRNLLDDKPVYMLCSICLVDMMLMLLNRFPSQNVHSSSPTISWPCNCYHPATRWYFPPKDLYQCEQLAPQWGISFLCHGIYGHRPRLELGFLSVLHRHLDSFGIKDPEHGDYLAPGSCTKRSVTFTLLFTWVEHINRNVSFDYPDIFANDPKW